MIGQVLDIQKNLQYYPALATIERWKSAGLLSAFQTKKNKREGMPDSIASNAMLLQKLRQLGVNEVLAQSAAG